MPTEDTSASHLPFNGENGLPPDYSPSLEPTPDKAPRRARGVGSGRAKAVTEKDVVEGLTRAYGLVGMGLFALRPYKGMIVIEHAPTMAQSLANVGKRDKRAWAVLQLIARGNDIAEFAGVHLAVVSALAADSGLVPWGLPRALGITTFPDDMDSRPSAHPAYQQQQTQGPSNVMPTEFGELVSDTPSHSLNGNIQGTPTDGAVQVSPDTIELIRAEALRRMVLQNALAERQGSDGVPNPAHNPAGGSSW